VRAYAHMELSARPPHAEETGGCPVGLPMPVLLPAIMALLLASAGCRAFDAGPVSDSAGGSASNSAACLEESTPLAPDDETELGVTASELAAFIAGQHVAELHWNHLADSRLTLKVSPRAASYVHARFRSQQEIASHLRTPTQQCSDYIRIQAALEIESADGRLAEALPRVDLLAYSPYEVRGVLEIEADALSGDYTPASGSQRCFVALRLRILLERTGTSGSITELLGPGVCSQQGGPLTSFAGGGWGTRWQNY
jgi:hypothetical protein